VILLVAAACCSNLKPCRATRRACATRGSRGPATGRPLRPSY